MTILYNQKKTDSLVFLIFFVLFPRDQSFYVLFVINVAGILTVLLKIWYQRPQIYYNPEVNSGDTSSHIHSAYCGHHSDMSFGWPADSILLQAAFDWTMFFTVFYTGKNSNLSKSLHTDLHLQRLSIVTKSTTGYPPEKLLPKYENGSAPHQMSVSEDVFQNDLVNWSGKSPSFNQSEKAKKYCRYGCQILAIIWIHISCSFEALISLFKGQQGFANIFTSYLIGLWLSVFLFYFWRRRIQRHIRQILESDTEFKVETLIKNNQDLSQNCKFVFLTWVVFGLGTQIYIFVRDGEFVGKHLDHANDP